MGNKVRYFALIAAVLLLIIQFFISDYSSFFGWDNLLPFISLICIIISLAGSIIYVNNQTENK